jgi:PKD repeat protein
VAPVADHPGCFVAYPVGLVIWIKQLAAGYNFSLALKDDGSIVAWGGNDSGQLNVPSGNGFVDIDAGDSHGIAIRQNGSIAAWGSLAWAPEGNDFIGIAAGRFHSLALRSDGTILTSGISSGCSGNNFIAVDGGRDYNLTLRENGSLCGGWDPAPTGNAFIAISAGSRHSLALSLSPLISSFTATPLAGEAPLEVTFTCVAHDFEGTIVRYKLDYDDGHTETNDTGEFTYQYDTPATYYPTCTATDNDDKKIVSDPITIVVEEPDSDDDGIPDSTDNCINDHNPNQSDTDNDGIGDVCDNCPNDPDKVEEGVCGCGVPDTDTDNDLVLDCIDNCPNDPNKITPGICGCDVPDTDSDQDGTPDCNDDCDSNLDTDGDGVGDCDENCPNDPDKTDPGVCGCGLAETDTDNDGTPDCIDFQIIANIISPASNQKINVGKSVNFQCSVLGGNPPFTYLWNFDSAADNSTQRDPGDVTFSEVGTYTVTLSVADDDGDIDSDTVAITVKEEPDGDGGGGGGGGSFCFVGTLP